MPTLNPRVFAYVLCAALLPAPARAIEWPVAPTVQPDPIRELRWAYVSRWVAPNHPRLGPAMSSLEGSAPGTAQGYARLAILLRLRDLEDPCRAALASALRAQPDITLGDSDLGLTQAWLQARAHDWSGAFDSALLPLSRLPPSPDREKLVLDLARWSMARGPEGLRPALTLVRQYLSLMDPQRAPLVQVTAALILARMNRIDEARMAARAVSEALRPELGSDNAPLGDGALVLGEGDAATGVALVLVGRLRDAVEPLTRASTSVPGPWRPFIAAQLAQARRSPPAPGAPSSPEYPLPNAFRGALWPD